MLPGGETSCVRRHRDSQLTTTAPTLVPRRIALQCNRTALSRSSNQGTLLHWIMCMRRRVDSAVLAAESNGQRNSDAIDWRRVDGVSRDSAVVETRRDNLTYALPLRRAT